MRLIETPGEESSSLTAMPPDIVDWHEQARIVGRLKHVLQPPRLVLDGTRLARRHQAEAQPKRIIGINIGREVGPGARLAAQTPRAFALQVHQRVFAG